MSGVAGFDPEDTRAQPLRIREQAQRLHRVGGDLTGRQDSLTFVLHSLAGSFSEVLHPLIAARVGEQYYTVQELVGAMLYGEQVTNGWAEDVVAFQQHRAILLDRWESACRNGFWITRAPGYANVEPEMLETLYDDARHRVLIELNAEADLAHTTLSLAAQDRGRQFREGPTTSNVLNLIGAGRLGGPGLSLLYPFLPVPGPGSGLARQFWGMTAEQLVRAAEDDRELSALLVARRPDPDSADPFEAVLAQAVLIAGADADDEGYGVATAARVAEVAALLAGIPAKELALLSALFPAVVGNLDGMPFENRIAANRVNVAEATHQARQERASVLAEIDQSRSQRYTEPALRYRLADLDAQIAQYELLLNEPTLDYGAPESGPPWPDYRGRKVIYFDPSGDGSWAELVGTISAETEDVGVLVPGVGTDSRDMFNKSNQATEFVAQAARDGERLAMIVWAGGDFPDTMPVAISGSYADDLIHPLVDFSYAIRQEVDDQLPGGHVPVTVIGHSYGGMAVSMATLSGLSADRLLFVNSAGAGTGEVGQLANYEVYAMSAPGDVVPMLGPLVHETAPIDLAGVVELATGTYRDGTPLCGLSSHAGVFEESSTAWENMLAVLTGRPVLVAVD